MKTSSTPSPAKIAANRLNAQRSTGPKTQAGKKHSRQNAMKHGLLASVLITDGEDARARAVFHAFLRELTRDLLPVGSLENMLVEKIAVSCWRQRRALKCEAELINRALEPSAGLGQALGHGLGFLPFQNVSEQASLALPADLDRILRYETTSHRQLVYAINQLERLQRARKGEQVPAPVNVAISADF